MKNRKIVITGASKGIGRAIAKKLNQPYGIKNPQNFKAPNLFN